MGTFKDTKEIRGKTNGPLVNVTSAIGGSFVGELLPFGGQEVTGGLAVKYLYQFHIRALDKLLIQKKTDQKDGEGKAIYAEVDVTPEDAVNLFATKPLHEKLRQAEPGRLYRITYNGKMLTKNKKNKYHDFKVAEVEEVADAAGQ